MILVFMSIHLLIRVSIQNNEAFVLLEGQIFFKLIKIKKQIYPPKKKKNKKNKKYKLLSLLKGELQNIYNVVKKIKVVELYSNIEFGHDNFYTTVYVDAFINAIYANIANMIKSKKLYLNIVPNFTEKKIKGVIKIHIKFRIIGLYKFIPILIRMLKKIKYLKEENLDDGNKLDTEYYGNNSGNN